MSGFQFTLFTTTLITFQSLNSSKLSASYLKTDKIVPGSYMPFFIGPGNCIGMRFALMEVKLTLAKLVLKYKFILTEDVVKHKPKFAISDHYFGSRRT